MPDKALNRQVIFKDRALNSLLMAAINRNVEEIENLIQFEVSHDMQAQLLYHLLVAGDYDTVHALIDAGVSPNSMFSDCPLLWLATWRGDLRMVKFLLERGASTRFRNKSIGSTPLDVATLKGYSDIVGLLTSNSSEKSDVD